MKTRNFLVVGAFLTTGLTMLTSCCCDSDDITTAEKVALYYLKDSNFNVERDTVDAYFDFSNGMNSAYANDTTQQIVKSIVNKLTSDSSTKIFSLYNDSIVSLSERQTHLFNAIMLSTSYCHQYAPIEKALDNIVKRGNNALLVTDFEEYTPDGVVQRAAFASRYFEKWLGRGGSITFFVTDYMEGNLAKHLYYIVFNKRDHFLLGKIEDALDDQPVNYQTYTLSTNPCKVFTAYRGAAYGGNYMDADGIDVVSATINNGDAGETYYNFNLGGAVSFLKDSRYFKNGVPMLPTEYYPFDCNWTEIVENAKAMSEEGVTPKFTHLLRNLFVDLTNTDSYTVKGMSVIATDVEEDMDKYVENLIALSNKPKMISDGEGGFVADLQGDASKYYDEKGQLLPEYQYDASHPLPTSEIKDFLVLDQKLFNTTKTNNPSKVEIGIKFIDGASGQIQGYKPGDMIRLDIVIAQCEPNTNRLQELFSWSGNTNLKDAIVNTLQNLNPVGRVVYSYFIKTTE